MNYRVLNYAELLDRIDYLSHFDQFNYYFKNNYIVIQFPNCDNHVTIFQDQWDQYYSDTGLHYYLFHITSNDSTNICSSYFWIDMETNLIKKIPPMYFEYNQKKFGLYS